jgi:hypothetical protein
MKIFGKHCPAISTSLCLPNNVLAQVRDLLKKERSADGPSALAMHGINYNTKSAVVFFLAGLSCLNLLAY